MRSSSFVRFWKCLRNSPILRVSPLQGIDKDPPNSELGNGESKWRREQHFRRLSYRNSVAANIERTHSSTKGQKIHVCNAILARAGTLALQGCMRSFLQNVQMAAQLTPTLAAQ